MSGGDSHTFDSFECAIRALAPVCEYCSVKVIGHGVEADVEYVRARAVREPPLHPDALGVTESPATPVSPPSNGRSSGPTGSGHARHEFGRISAFEFWRVRVARFGCGQVA